MVGGTNQSLRAVRGACEMVCSCAARIGHQDSQVDFHWESLVLKR